jgi:hypothetical protein
MSIYLHDEDTHLHLRILRFVIRKLALKTRVFSVPFVVSVLHIQKRRQNSHCGEALCHDRKTDPEVPPTGALKPVEGRKRK